MGCMQSTSASEPSSAPPASNKLLTEQPPVSQAVEPEAEAPPKSTTVQAYKISGVSVTEVGVVFYIVEAADGSLSIKRRYNDFKALYVELGPPAGLPALPVGGMRTALRGKQNPQLIQEREQQFAVILNAIAADQELAASPAFQKFLSAE